MDGGHGSLAKEERRWGFIFVTPWILGIIFFFLVPLALSLLMSFTNFRLVANEDESVEWVGLANWSRLFEDPNVTDGVAVTFRFALLFIPMSVLVPLALAYLLTSDRLWGKSFFRVMFYLPSMVPLVAAIIIWRFFLNQSSGWPARIFNFLGLGSPGFLSDPNLVLITLMLIAAWGVGNGVIINIAALHSVPKELYEAARIDGASRWRQFRHITWPMISPITFYNVVIALVGLGQYFIVPFILFTPAGNPDGATRFYTMVFFQETFSFFDAGYGATLAWAMFLVVSAITALLFWSAKFWVHYEYEER